MGFTVPLRILLICLVHFCAAVDANVDPTTLKNIVKNLENQLGDQGQYAVAFSVEKKECEEGSTYTGPDLTKVKETFKSEENDVYNCDNLIAAKPKLIKTAKPPYTEHSEFRLQNYLKNILNKEDRCVIYFTVNSPCMDKCLNHDGGFNIEQSLKMLQAEKNVAFVFKKIWKDDAKEKAKVIKRLKEIAPNLPYYQCNPGCVKL